MFWNLTCDLLRMGALTILLTFGLPTCIRLSVYTLCTFCIPMALRMWLRVPGPPAFQHGTLKSWEWTWGRGYSYYSYCMALWWLAHEGKECTYQKIKYHIAKNFRMVQIFVYFVCACCVRKENLNVQNFYDVKINAWTLTCTTRSE